MSDPAAPALEARLAIRVGSGDRAFAVEAELALDAGVLVLFGASGVGKTLTLQALAGLITPASGHLRVRGEALFDAARRIDVPAHRRRIGYVPQQHALFPFLDVAGNVAFGLPRAERRGARVGALLDELGIAKLAAAHPGSLSGGERQRVSLARALAVEPRLLLLDEPFASIDEEGRAALRRLLREVIDRRKMPAVLVTHDAGEAMTLGDRLVRFERGRTVAAGDPRELLGGGDRVVVTGASIAAAEAIGEGRARVLVRDAVIEGPAEMLPRAAGEDVRIELKT
jgi:molybdate transport system ATP-binding protein